MEEYLGRKIIAKKIFTKKEDQPFDAFYQAEAYLNEIGYSYGSLSVTTSNNIAIQKGQYKLPQKWHNLNKEDSPLMDGVIRSLDYRNGEVSVYLFK